jgi:glycosyltransferase involved in cell wall biosynthesis
MVEFCVAIRTFNGAKRLPAVLKALRSQVGLESTTWEVLVVDNRSTDQTADIVKHYQAQWPPHSQLRYCYEPRQGASFARRRAIEAAASPLIGFLDDDNVPAADWVQAALAFAQVHPDAAAFGSQIHGKFETSPPKDFDRIAGFLPIVERDQSICFTTGSYGRTNMLPPGAGLVIRRQAWLDHVPENLVLTGPVGTSLVKKGEDIEALLYLKRAGWHIWFNANMHVYHHIPKSRFERSYLLRFFQGVGLGKAHIRTINCASWQKPFRLALFMANDFRKLFLHWVKYRHTLQDDVVAASELQLLWSSFISPVHGLISLSEPI